MPAFAGMTEFRTFYEFVNIDDATFFQLYGSFFLSAAGLYPYLLSLTLQTTHLIFSMILELNPDKPELTIEDLSYRSPRRRRYNPYEPEALPCLFNLNLNQTR